MRHVIEALLRFMLQGRAAWVWLVLTWTAVGDDGMIGLPHHYELQVAADSTFGDPADLYAPAPMAPGTQMWLAVPDAPIPVWYRIRAVDEAGNAGSPWGVLLVLPDVHRLPSVIRDLR